MEVIIHAIPVPSAVAPKRVQVCRFITDYAVLPKFKLSTLKSRPQNLSLNPKP